MRPTVPAAALVLAAWLTAAPVAGQDNTTATAPVAPAVPEAGTVRTAHAIAMHGTPRYGPDFTHFDYVNPAAPKGGTVRFASPSPTFDSLHPFIIRGVPAAGIGRTFDTLLTSSMDEPFTEYGLLAETVSWPEDRSWVEFTLRPEARFHDGSPLTIDDVIFSFDMLRERGRPFYRFYFAGVETVTRTGPRSLRFDFAPGENRELPLILGQFPVFSAASWEGREFDRPSLEPVLGSGPYRVAEVDPGRSIAYERVGDYWGRDLPVNVGQNNYDRIVYLYYRDQTVSLEAFKAGEYDIRVENNSKEWATAYTGPPFRDGRILLESIPNSRPTGMQGFLFNTRRAIFADPRVREALAYAFDFEWSNRNLFYSQYTRTESYFSNSSLAASGLPGPAELAILEPWRERLPAAVFDREYAPPSGDGSGNIRDNLRAAFRLLADAGWVVRDLELVNAETGTPMRFEILLVSPAFERIVAPFVHNLGRLGIGVSYRTVDTAQYQNRIRDFDFDMIVASIGQSESPGNEQRNYWVSSQADVPGSRNWAGVRDPVVDDLVERIIAARSREELVATTRALDRVLLWGHYVIPQWHIRTTRVAWWDRFGRPDIVAAQGSGLEGWWVDPALDQALERRRSGG